MFFLLNVSLSVLLAVIFYIAIIRVNHWDEKIDSIIQKGWKMRLGNGKNIHLWTDKWLVDCPLKEIYSRLFSVSAQRCEFVSNMGFWKDNLWHWNLLWRRQLFQWEVDQLHDLIKLLEAVILTVNTDDKLWWHFDYKGEFSVKSFSKACSSERRLDEDDRITPSVWRGVAPPRAALLLWFVLRGRINTRSRLKWCCRLVHLVQFEVCSFCI
jgi:hypothetical protein